MKKKKKFFMQFHRKKNDIYSFKKIHVMKFKFKTIQYLKNSISKKIQYH